MAGGFPAAPWLEPEREGGAAWRFRIYRRWCCCAPLRVRCPWGIVASRPAWDAGEETEWVRSSSRRLSAQRAAARHPVDLDGPRSLPRAFSRPWKDSALFPNSPLTHAVELKTIVKYLKMRPSSSRAGMCPMNLGTRGKCCHAVGKRFRGLFFI